MRAAAVGLLLVTAGLAGCIGSDGGSLEASDATDPAVEEEANASVPSFPNGTPAPTELVLRDCVEHWGIVPVPPSVYEDRLPDGFTLASFEDEPTGETASLLVIADACQSSEEAHVVSAVTVLKVNPPETWEPPDASHWLVLSIVTSSEHVAAIKDAWGFADTVREGTANLDTTETPAARAGTLEASAGPASLTMGTAVAGQPSEDDGANMRLFALGDDGTVTGAKDIELTPLQRVGGEASVSGSPEAGLPETVPVPPGGGGHFWGFSQHQTYVDLPPREGG